MASARVRVQKRSLQRQKPEKVQREGKRHEVLGTLVFGLGLALLMALVSWKSGGANLVGPAGQVAAAALFAALGAGAYVAALAVLGFSISLFRQAVRLRPLSALAWLFVVAACAAMAHLAIDPAGWGYLPGGALGMATGEAARAVFGTAGSLVLLLAAGLAALVLASGFSVVRAAALAATAVVLAWQAVVSLARVWISRRQRARERSEQEAAERDASAMVEELLAGEDARIPPPIVEATPRNITAPPASGAGAGAGAGALARPAASSAPKSIPPVAPAIVAPKPPPKPTAKPPPAPVEHKGWVLPPLSLIGDARAQAHVLDKEALTRTAEKLTAKLADFGVEGRVVEIRPGPVVTMYEFAPGPGIKLSRIAGLADDLAMAMEALRVRIVAPIPGKGVVGIEVPNRDRETVYFKEILEQDLFQKSASRLTMALGKDIEGMPFVVDLARMPHLLIAGTTGSGKSVSVNSMLLAMLFKATPDEVRFLMVDPKMLELSVYEGIPHLLLPVVTDPKKAALALRWALEEMERRYQMLADAGVRNIQTYNKWVDAGAVPPAARAPAKKVVVVDVSKGESEEMALDDLRAAEEMARVKPAEDKPHVPPRRLPFIVIIIDELADLMMVASREVETYIARLAQMARAAGIHLMVATQRPSTDVVTGVIKANFPARVSFQVASRHDSATIINTPGAENLLGMGDMLILPPGTGNLTRVHGAYVSEEEIHGVVAHWKAQGAPKYDMDILKPRAEDLEEGGGEDDQLSDELYDQALAAVAEMQQVSISLLQRKMRIGYNRAARMIERMERDGVVGPADGAKPRDVLIRPVGEMPGAGA